MANNTKNITILPEDRVDLTVDQQNLIELAIAKQAPPEDIEFMEKIQKETSDVLEAYSQISEHFIAKYGDMFGTLYLAAITNGEQGYDEAKQFIEESNAEQRQNKEKLN